MGQRPLFILRCAWGATARDAEYNGGIVVNSSNVTAVQRCREGNVEKVGVAPDPKRVGPASWNLEYG